MRLSFVFTMTFCSSGIFTPHRKLSSACSFSGLGLGLWRVLYRTDDIGLIDYFTDWFLSRQVMVLLHTHSMLAAGVSPSGEAMAPPRQGGATTAEQPTGGVDRRPQQPMHHRQQLQPETQSHMRPRRKPLPPHLSAQTTGTGRTELCSNTETKCGNSLIPQRTQKIDKNTGITDNNKH